MTSSLPPNPDHAAGALMQTAQPRKPRLHLFDTADGPHVLLANASRIYGLPAAEAARLTEALQLAEAAPLDALLHEWGLHARGTVDDQPLADPPVRALSLAVAQKCNLGCTYCYAQEGDFGGAAVSMPLATALASVDLLLSDAGPGDRVNLAFMGGEPLLNRPVLQAATTYAARRARERGTTLTFSLTTNGTLLTEEDGEFLEAHGFAVTISLDGVGEVHDRLRPCKGGQGSYERILRRVEPLLARQRRMQVSARVTVTPQNLDLRATLNEFIHLGFHSVGFSPMLTSPTGRAEMDAEALAQMLAGMVECGEEFDRQVLASHRYPFANMTLAMQQLHRGTHRPYPCGAGAGYLGVAATGELAACHRFAGDEAGALGSLAGGLDRGRQRQWLAERHVHRQHPCQGCWARYHEVLQRGRKACDFIRGWLHYALGAYVRLSARQPAFFAA
jgi:uncharacterized protein